jgi:hypothetical protein
LSISLPNEVKEQQTVRSQPEKNWRRARFNVTEPLQDETFAGGESKQCLPIIAQCFVPFNGGHPQKHR